MKVIKMILTLNQIYPDFIGTCGGKTVTLDTYKKSIKIILGSKVFTTDEIKYLSDTLEYNDLIKIIVFNSTDKIFISNNVIYIDSNDEVLDQDKACIVDRHNIIQYIGNKISDVERDCMVILSGLGCELSKHW